MLVLHASYNNSIGMNLLQEREMLKICHDMKNPLIGNISMIENQGSLKKKEASLLKTDLEMILNMVDIVMIGYKMKQYSGVIQEKAVNVKTSQMLDRVSKSVFKLIKSNLINYSVKVMHNFPATMHLQENKVFRVLINLISNAIKHSFNSKVMLRLYSSVDLDCKSLPEYHIDFITSKYNERKQKGLDTAMMIFEVYDEGCGIPKDKIGDIFEEGNTTSDLAHNLGLGLSIVKGICDSMGAEISVNSEEKKYTSFMIVLFVQEDKLKLDQIVNDNKDVMVTFSQNSDHDQVKELSNYHSDLDKVDSVKSFSKSDSILSVNEELNNSIEITQEGGIMILFLDDEYNLLQNYKHLMQKLEINNFKTFTSHFKLLMYLDRLYKYKGCNKVVLFSDKNLPGTNGYELVDKVRLKCKEKELELVDFIVTADADVSMDEGYIELEKPLSGPKLKSILAQIM